MADLELRARVERAVAQTLRPALGRRPSQIERALVDAVMAAVVNEPVMAAKVAAAVHVNRDLPAAADLMSFRERRGLTRQQVAEIVGVAEHTVGQWERGEQSPKRGTLERARYLGLVDLMREKVGA